MDRDGREGREQRKDEEARYDREALRKVTALAQELQRRHDETLSAEEIEAAGTEVGLRPPFIRQALGILERKDRPVRGRGHAVAPRRSPAPLAIPVAWSTLALWAHLALGSSPGDLGAMLLVFLYMAAPFPIAGLCGYLAGRKWEGFLSGAILFLGLFLGMAAGMPYASFGPDPFTTLMLVMCGAATLGATGALGATLRQRLAAGDAPPPRREISRGEMLSLLGSLRQELEPNTELAGAASAALPGGAGVMSAVMSVDVVDALDLRCEAEPAEVEAAFEALRQWAGEVVASHQGRLERGAGDTLVCLFPTDTEALRAARRLLEGLYWFNAECHQLPSPFRLRCGVSAGEAGLPANAAFGYLESPLHRRAQVLQARARPGEVVVDEAVTGAALRELGRLERLGAPGDAQPAFGWRAA